MAEGFIEYNWEAIELTASNSETEPFRINRLHRVWGYVLKCAMDADMIASFTEGLVGLHDHKGTLEVKWRRKPSKEERMWFSEAWESPIAFEVRDFVEHKLFVKQ